MQNPKNLAIGHLNVNFLRNKFATVEELAQNIVDIWFFSEIRLDEAYPNQKYMINGYKLFFRDRNCHGGDILCYIMKVYPSTL